MDQIISTFNPDALAESYAKMLEQMNGNFLFLVIYCIALVLTAFYSYRILRLELSISAALAGGYFGYLLLAPLLLEKIADTLPEGVDFAVVIGVVCAILGWILAWVLHKIAVFLVGASGGFFGGTFAFGFIASMFPEVEFLSSDIFYWIITIVCALLAGVIFVYLFKFLYIFITSFGGMVGASYLLGVSMFGENAHEPMFLYPTLAVGAVFGLIAMVVQYKKAEDKY